MTCSKRPDAKWVDKENLGLGRNIRTKEVKNISGQGGQSRGTEIRTPGKSGTG
jgi:hypothetical protein